MDVLIKNMNNKPKNCILEEHLSDGTVIKHEVVEVPPHGDLIDKASVLSLLQYYCYMREYKKDVRCEDCENRNACVVRPIMDEVNKLDTVLEAST